MKRVISALVLSLVLGFTLCATACAKGVGGGVADGDLAIDDDFVCTITVDGGGQWADYNTTSSMTESASNPYPYDTLKTLADEYTALHPNVTVKINSQSSGGSRDSILPMLSTATAPDILFQVPTTLAEDCRKNYFAPLDEYLKLPNPYSAKGEAGSQKWADVYRGELQATVDGHYYYAALERSVIGITYNKTFFDANNLSAPETYAEFVSLIDTIHGINSSVYPYSPNGGELWLDLALECALFSDTLKDIDVITPDGFADAQEILRAYELGIWSPESELYGKYLDLITLKTDYTGDPTRYTGTTEFLNGNVIMVETAGSDMNFLQKYCNFEVGVFTFPLLTSDTAGVPTGIKNVNRGSSGLSTAWFITNHAFSSQNDEDNRKKINACADFLMYLTAYKNNDRLVGDKGVAVPLSGNTENETFAALMAQYEEDRAKDDFVIWASFNPSSTLTKSYYDSYVIAYDNYLYGSNSAAAKHDKETMSSAVMNAMDSAMYTLVRSNSWDKNSWSNIK